MFVDVNEKYKEKLILPRISISSFSPDKNKRSTSVWTMPDSQRKLNQVDALMLSLAENVIYIGSFPAHHFASYRLQAWKIIFIDPKIDDDNITLLQAISEKAFFEKELFEFSSRYFEILISKYEIFGNVVIIDDSYDDDIISNFSRCKNIFL